MAPPLFVLQTVSTTALDAVIHFVANFLNPPSIRFTSGIWAAQPAQITSPRARIDGVLPFSISGMFVTVGPNPRHMPLGGYHAFEGDGALVCVRLRDGHASFAYTHLATAKMLADRRRGFSTSLSFQAVGVPGSPALPLLFFCALRALVAPDKPSPSTANTNVEQHAGRILALWEGDRPYQLRPSADGCSLQCAKQIPIPYSGPFSAHPVRHCSGRLFSVGYDVVSLVRDAVVVSLDSRGRLQRIMPLRLGRKTMIHDAAITKRYLLIFDFPLIIDPLAFITGNKLISYHAKKRCRVGLMPVDAKNANQVRWFDIEPCFAFHAICAWDTPRGVVLHLSQMEGEEADILMEALPSRIMRYEFDVVNGTCKSEQLPMSIPGYDSLSLEFPVTNVNFSKRITKFTYLCMIARDVGSTEARFLGVVKYNLHNRAVEAVIKFNCDGREADAIGEVKFVAKEDEDGDEDDGYLMVYLRDEAGDIRMSIYDAKTMSDIAIASVHAPKAFHVPNGFHSEFISHSALQNAVVST